MNDIPADWRGQLDIREQIARIDRNLAETSKLLAEEAEASRFHREQWIIPLTAFLALLAAIFLARLEAIASRLPELLHAFGVG